MSTQPLTEGDVRLTTQQREDLRTVLDNFGRHSITSDMLDAVERLNDTVFPATEPAEASGNRFAECDSSTPVVHIHHHDIEAHAASFNEGYDEAVRQFAIESSEEATKAEGPCGVSSPQGDACSFPKPRHAGVHTWAWPDKSKPAEEGA